MFGDYETDWIITSHTDAYFLKIMERIWINLGIIREKVHGDFDNRVITYEYEPECKFESSYEDCLKKAKEEAADGKQLKKAITVSIQGEIHDYERRIRECKAALNVVENYDEDKLQKDAWKRFISKDYACTPIEFLER